jgi:hypothetical protein
MKKWIFLFLLFLVVPVLSLAIDLENVTAQFQKLVEDYESGSPQDPFVSYVKENIPQLQKYRIFRRFLAGSVEKTEFAKTPGDYLFVLYQSWKETNWERKLSNVLFLSYLQSMMSGSKPSESVLKNSPAFNSFFAEYRMFVRSNALNLIRWILAYYTGGTNTPPPVEFNLGIRKLGFSFNVNHDVHPDILKLLPEDLETKLKEAIEEIASSKNQAEYTRNINRQASLLWKEFESNISALQNEVAGIFENTSLSISNFWWIRFVVYGVLLVIFLRKYRTILQFIIAAEILFIWVTKSLYLNTVENMIFSTFVVFTFIFFNFIFLVRKRYLYPLLSLIFVFLLFIPSYISVREMGMDSAFENSPYYNQLKVEIFEDPDSHVKTIINRINTIALSSKEHTKQIVETLGSLPEELLKIEALKSIESTKNGIFLQLNDRSKFFTTAGFEDRLNLTGKIEGDLSDYLSQEKSRYRKYKREIKSLDQFVERITSYTSEKFSQDFERELTNTIERYPLIEGVSFSYSTEKRYLSLKPYRTVNGLIGIFTFFLLFFSAVLGGRYLIFPAAATLFTSILSMIKWKHLEVFVESGIFPLIIETSSTHTFHIEVFLIFVSLFLLYKNFMKRRVKA